MTQSKLLLTDDFRDGLDLIGSWAITRFPRRFSADDGIVSTSDRGLYVRAAGTNLQTGEPAFSETAAGEDDHVKWMIDTLHISSNSVPGFDAVLGQDLQITMRARGRTFGTQAHPFGSAVANPDTDLRLASFSMNTIDFETGMVFDVWMTNNAIYPYYERLNLTGTATYAVFSSAVIPASWTDRRWTSLCVARRLPALAPLLAPRKLVCFADGNLVSFVNERCRLARGRELSARPGSRSVCGSAVPGRRRGE